jgi:hypothetical protein
MTATLMYLSSAGVHLGGFNMKKAVMLCVAGAVVLGVLVSAQTASAIPPFKAEWDKLYMGDGTEMNKALDGKSNCNVCHVGAKNKKLKNDYGKALGELIKKDDAKNTDKIKAAMEEVAAMPSDAEDKDSPTFGTLIEEGKLPITKDEP